VTPLPPARRATVPRPRLSRRRGGRVAVRRAATGRSWM